MGFCLAFFLGAKMNQRNFKIGRIQNAEDRTVKAVISTEHPVPRFKGNEILVHNTDSIDLTREPLPLIIAHDNGTLPVGVVEHLEILDRELHGVLRISKSQDAIWQDIQDGILRHVSVGYMITEEGPVKDGAYRVTKWQPYECSLVSAPADPQAKINRKHNEVKKMDVNDLKQQRKASVDKMQQLAQAEELTDEQKEEIRTLKSDIETFDLRISALEETKESCRLQTSQVETKPLQSEEYSRAYDKFLRQGQNALFPEEIRILTVGNDASMGYAVPEEFEKKLLESLHENNIMRQICKVISTSSDRNIPIVTGDTTAHWLAENAEYIASDVTLEKKVLEAHKLGVLSLASEELVSDLGFNLTEFLSSNFGRAMGDLEENSFINGDGTGKPRGVLADAEVGVTAAEATSFTYDELMDLIYSLKRPYRKRASFLLSDEAMNMIRKFQDGSKQYLIQEPLKAGEPTTILGYPVYTSSFVPALESGQKAVLFGDFSYYWIADRQGRYFQTLRERYAEKGQVGFRGNQRIDGCLTIPEAVKVLQLA